MLNITYSLSVRGHRDPALKVDYFDYSVENVHNKSIETLARFEVVQLRGNCRQAEVMAVERCWGYSSEQNALRGKTLWSSF